MTPRNPGRFQIPPLSLSTPSETVQTQPLTIHVTEGGISADLQMRVNLSKTRFFLGETVLLTVEWTLVGEGEDFLLNLPVLDGPPFTLQDPDPRKEPGKRYTGLRLGEGMAFAETSSESLEGKVAKKFAVRRHLTAKESGTFLFPGGTVSCRTLQEQAARDGNPFELLWDKGLVGSRHKRRSSKALWASAPPITLTVVALPEEGKPSHFSGLVGHFGITTSARPEDVVLGEPLTLSVFISGSSLPQRLKFASLVQDSALWKDFTVPEEMAAGEVRDGGVVFFQSLRPKSFRVREIPSLSLVYFDPDTAEYRLAQSDPIPIRVRPGPQFISEGHVGAMERKHTSREGEWLPTGIAHNYEGDEILVQQDMKLADLLRSPLWMGLLLAPVLAYMTTFLHIVMKRRSAKDEHRRRARKAFALFRKQLKGIEAEAAREKDACRELIGAFQAYFGAKFHRLPGSLTMNDMRGEMEQRGLEPWMVEELKTIFDYCENRVYGGGNGPPGPFRSLSQRALALLSVLDKRI